MKILIIGEPFNLAECQKKFGEHDFSLATDHDAAALLIPVTTVVFDFVIDRDPYAFKMYADNNVSAFINTCKITLAELAYSVNHQLKSTIFGFNGLPTMLGRTLLEVSVLDAESRPLLDNLCKQLNTEYILVEDRVGMVTPRVISMIINEAYYAVQEGTATREDIDLAMKLGTNYPYGPFEWCEKIGVRNIYELLEAVYNDTKDERYKICPLLKREYLKHLV
jgi:3-hydroxybutyryl-CoA dehydrogenase